MFEVKNSISWQFCSLVECFRCLFSGKKVIYEAPVLIQYQIVVKQNVPQGQISSHRANVRQNLYRNHLQD